MANFGVACTANWQAIHKEVFGIGIPDTKEWTDINEIILVLNAIGAVRPSNHTFLPRSGGVDLTGARKFNSETGCIEVCFEVIWTVLKPKKLTYHKIDNNLEWSYFYLETQALPLSGVEEYEDEVINELWEEEVVDYGSGEYSHRNDWIDKDYRDDPLPDHARLISRVFKPVSFAVFKKSSRYNKQVSEYLGEHSKMEATEFRNYIKDKCKEFGKDPFPYPDRED